jgi:deoxycytidylate deaminase
MKYLSLLKKLRHFSNHPQHKMSAIVVKGNRIFSCGFNKVQTHPKSNAYDNMIHAEVSALIGLNYETTKGATIYIYREKKTGEMGLSKPCPSCQAAIQEAGIRKIIYSNETGWTEERVA